MTFNCFSSFSHSFFFIQIIFHSTKNEVNSEQTWYYQYAAPMSLQSFPSLILLPTCSYLPRTNKAYLNPSFSSTLYLTRVFILINCDKSNEQSKQRFFRQSDTWLFLPKTPQKLFPTTSIIILSPTFVTSDTLLYMYCLKAIAKL